MSDPRNSEEANNQSAVNPESSAPQSRDTEPQPPPDHMDMRDNTILRIELPPELQELKRQMEARLDHAAPAASDVPNGNGEAQRTAEMQTCPRCDTPFEKGTKICSRCGMLLNDEGKTRLLNVDEAGAITRLRSMGGGLFSDQQPLMFEVDGVQIEIPIAEYVVVGRASSGSSVGDDGEPDVSLSEFNAVKRGVSRRHMAIRRKGPLIYVADLESTNGTFLNGRRLMKAEERIIRDGDEIHLSHLLIRVSFPNQQDDD